MRKMKAESCRRMLSLLLTLVMLVQFVPVISFASGEEQTDSTFVGFADWSVSGGELSLGTGVSGNGAQIVSQGKEAVLQSSAVAVYEGEKLRVGISVKVPDGGTATLRLQPYGDTAAKISAGDPVVIGTQTAGGAFAEIAGDVAVPDGVKAIRVELVTGSGTYIADNAYVRAYTQLPELQGTMGDGYGVAGQWSLFYPLTYPEGQWSEQKDQTQDPYGYNYARIVSQGKEDEGAVRFHRASVYEHIGIAIGSELVIGQTYTLKLWVKGTAGADYNGLSLYANGDTELMKFGPDSGNTGDWTELTHTFTATRPHFYLFMSGGAYDCDILIDNIRILDSEGNDMLSGAGSFTGDGQVRLSSTNRLQNGDFEDAEYSYLSLEDFNGTFAGAQQENEETGWTLSGAGTLEVAVDDNGKYLLLTKGTGESTVSSPCVTVQGKQIYQLAMKLKTTGDVLLQGTFYDAQGNALSDWDPGVVYAGRQWSTVKELFTAPENAAMFAVQLVVSGNAGVTLMVDDVAVNPCTVDAAEEENDDPVTYPEDPSKVPMTIDPNKTCNVVYAHKEWTAFYPTGTPGDTWPEWDTASHYGEIVKNGCQDTGALHLVSSYYKNAGVGINAGMTVGQTYTLGMWVKGYSNAGRVLSMYGNGDHILVETFSDLTEDWSYVEVEFTATSNNLYFMACDWGVTDIYIDNITLTDASGNDLLAGYGDFWQEKQDVDTDSTEPETTGPVEDGKIPTAIDTGKSCHAFSAYTGIWTPFYPTGTPGDTWPEWDTDDSDGICHYGEVVAEGCHDTGSLRLRSYYYKNTGVGINAGMTAGEVYTLGMYVKGTSDSGKVLALYSNGDTEIIGNCLALMNTWTYYEIEFTATGSNLFLAACDWGVSDIYIDNITLTGADGVDLLAGYGDFCTDPAAEPESTEPGTTAPDSGKVAMTLDYTKLASVSQSYAGMWTPFCPTGIPGDTWPMWNAETHFGWIVGEGYQDVGSLHLLSAPAKNVGVATKAGMIPGQQYTLGLWAKGISNSGRVLAVYSNGDPVIIAESANLGLEWTYYEITFTAEIDSLYLFASDWGTTDIYVDNITLIGEDGVDLLSEIGGFCTDPVVEPETTAPEATEPATTAPDDGSKVPMTIDPDAKTSAYECPAGQWVPMYPAGTPDEGTWAAWDSTHYAEIVSGGYKDVGALYIKSCSGKNAGVAFNAGMTAGESYTLGLWAKGTSNSGQVLMSYANGDFVIIDTPQELNTEWTYYEVSFTASVGQINIFARDWGSTDIYIDNITLKNASGTDLLAGYGDFCQDVEPETTEPDTTVPESTEPDTTAPDSSLIPISIDTAKTSSAGGAYVCRWTPFYPTGTPGDTWPAWSTATHYGEIVEAGNADPGALHLVSAPSMNTGVAIDVAMVTGEQYTLGMYVKGTAASNRILAVYGHGDPILIGNHAYSPNAVLEQVPSDWTYIELTFTATSRLLEIHAADWGTADLYIDNITLTGTDGVDLLDGYGDFCKDQNAPDPLDPDTVTQAAMALDYSQISTTGTALANAWTPFTPNGTLEGEWTMWSTDTHYAWIEGDSYRDVGALHMKSSADTKVGVAIKPGLTVGEEYTLGMYVRGTSDAQPVLALYGNGDTAVIGSSDDLTVNWKYHTVTFTATVDALVLVVGGGNTDIYIDHVTLTDKNGTELLGDNGNFCTTTYNEPEPTEPETTEPETTVPAVTVQVPVTLDTSEYVSAYNATQKQWLPMYPTGTPDTGTWEVWSADSHYAEVVSEGHSDVGALHMKSNIGKNAGVGINAGMTAGEVYTLGLWAKGTSNSGQVMISYANGDFIIINTAQDLNTEWTYYEVSFTAQMQQLNLMVRDWGVTDLYVDNITLKNANGTDLLAGCGDFYTEELAQGMVQTPVSIDTSLQTGAYEAYEGQWVPMFPTGSPDSGTWAAWSSDSHYVEVVEEGHNDVGALHMKSNSGRNAAVAIKANMTTGQSYTLGLWVKGTSNSGRVLALYANGDPAIIGGSEELSEDWSYYEITFTANVQQINLMVADWGITDLYVDNITLKGADGVDLLSGYGDFYELTEASALSLRAPVSNAWALMSPYSVLKAADSVEEQVFLDTSKASNHGMAYDVWTVFYPLGVPNEEEFWPAWTKQDANGDYYYAEVAEEGYKDSGSLHFAASNVYKHMAVSINTTMRYGQTYTLGFWAKYQPLEASSTNDVLRTYANGDIVIMGKPEGVSVENDGKWHYVECELTCTNAPQLTLWWRAEAWGGDLWIDNITLTDSKGSDLLLYRGDFCERTAGEPHPDESRNLMEGGDFESVAELSIPGWIISGTAVQENSAISLKKGAIMQSLRYHVERDQILMAKWTGTDGLLQVQLGADDTVVTTYTVGTEGQLFSVPDGIDWVRVKYTAVDKPAEISLVELTDMGDPSNLDFELKAADSDMPLNWTTWNGINDASITAEAAMGAYTVQHQVGTGIDGSNALYVKLNRDIPQNVGTVGLSAVVDSIKIAVEPSTTYSFSYYAKMLSENGCIYAEVKCFKEDGTEDGVTQWLNGAFNTDGSGQWNNLKTTFSTGSETAYVMFRLETKASNAGAQFWIDRITYKVLGSSLEPNLDFELGEAGEVPLNWTTFERNYVTNAEGAFGTYTAVLEPTGSKDQSGALKVTKLTDDSTELYVCSTMLKVDPSSAYYFSYDAATLSAASGDQILMMLRQKKANGDNVADETKAFYWPTNAYATGYFNWSEFGAIFETAEDCEYIQVMFCFRGSKGYTAYVDNVALTKTDKIEDPNFDFEYAVGQLPLNWSFNGVLSKSSMSVYSDNVYSGSKALRVQRENGELDFSFVYAEKLIPVSAGDKIEVVANIASRSAVSGHFSMCFFGYGDQNIDLSNMVNAMYGQERITNSTDEWCQWDTYEMVWTVPKGVNYIQLCLRIGGTCNDMLIDDITVYNYTQNDNLIYEEDFADPAITTGLPGGWEQGQTSGTAVAKVNGQMSLTGNEDSNVEIFTKLYSLKTDYVYTLTADVFTTGTAEGQLIMEAVNWDGSVAGQPVVLNLSTGATDQQLKATFESLSAVYYRLILRKTSGNGSVCIERIQLHQTGEPSDGITWAGKWLTHPDETARIVESPHPFVERHYFFRHEINLDKAVETAQMQITADDKFTLYINGQQVYEETRTGDTWDLPVTVDITEYLTEGSNIIAIDMYNNIYAYGLLFDGIVKMEDESSLRFYSTSDTMIAAECYSDNPTPTVNSKWTEYDQMNWFYPDYDISTCSLWVHADEYASIGGGSWGNVDFDPTEYSDYKIISNEFTFPEAEITAGDTVRVTATLMLEKALPTTNSFQVNFWKRNTTSRICSGVLTLAEGKTTDDWPIGEEFTAEFDLQIPMFLAEGSYTVQFESLVSIVSDYFINNKVGNIKVVQIQRELTTTSSVEVVNGKATMIVNGEEKAAMWYARPERPSLFDEETVVKFGEVGVDTIVSYIFLNNTYGDVWTMEGFVSDLVDSMMLDTLAGNPEAQLIVALDFNAPDWWKEENPGELAALSETTVNNTNASFASEKWKEEAGAIMVEAINHMMSQPYANNIIGFKVTGGYTLEWNWWATSGVYTDVGDFSECGINAFRAWLTEKYGTDEALQEAYGNSQITLENAMPPAKELRADNYLDTVITIQDHPEFMDYELYMAELKADTIEYFAKLAKDAVDDRLMVGTYGGYFYSGGGYEFSSAVSNVYFQKLLQSENVDFIKSPWMYGMREIGDSAQYMGPVDSLDLYGKLWIIEDDTRLNLKEMAEGQDGRAAVGWTRNYQQSVEQLKRNFSYILSKGMGVSFYNLGWGYTDDDQYYGVIGQMYQEMTLAMGLNTESTAEIAVFVDGESQMLIPWESEYLNQTLYDSIYVEQLLELGHVGASYDMYLLDDLKDGLVPEHKINIFLATTQITEEERSAIESQLQRNGNILVWLFTDGIADGTSTDLSLMEDIIGMDLSIISTQRKQIATAKVFNNSHWLTEGMNMDQPYGVESYDKMSPVIAVTDSSATALAYHSTTSSTDGTAAGQVALAVKDMGDWISIYSAVPNMPQIMFRNMLEKVGGHIYTASGSDVIYANDHYVALHSIFAGERTIELPGNYTVYDVFNRQIVSTDTDSFTVTLSGKETRLFRLTEPETVQVYIGQNSGGTVSPKGLTELAPGDDMTFTVEADEGYRLSYMYIDGTKVFPDSSGSYSFEDIRESHTVIAHFSPSYSSQETEEEPEPVIPVPAKDNGWIIWAVCGGIGLIALIAVIVLLLKRKKKA